MEYRDKYRMTKEQNRCLVKMNFTQLVHITSRFEGVTTTLPETQTIIDGLGVSGVPVDDINTIVQLKRAWQYIITEESPLTLAVEQKINQITARGDFVPPEVDFSKEKKYFTMLMEQPKMSMTEKALRLMYHNMRQQIFWDGNKRTAFLVANKLLIDHGIGILSISLDLWPKWNELISDYYFSRELAPLLAWTYENGIFGIDVFKA
ncbi:Fic family protein [Ligilactobacillus animalis]|uniref:Fic family protein n=1 Tax=Ligilactobacillus animalis TaxID=1605 RepID=UPI002A7554FC|nr:Fic family protein [Ligilactobacillus animalis]MDY2993529.1 Fic family protein [Ligilactobacillus animalis]